MPPQRAASSLRMTCIEESSGRGSVNFQVNGETYFLSLAEDERRWLVFVEGVAGTRNVPVYEDGPELEDVTLVIEDKERRKILN